MTTLTPDDVNNEITRLWEYVTTLREELEASYAIKCLAGEGQIRCQLVKGHHGDLHDDLCQFQWRKLPTREANR